MRNRLLCQSIALPLAAALALGAVSAASAAPKKKGSLKSSAGLTPSERAGIPPEAFGSPVASPDGKAQAWIADEGDGPNLFAGDPGHTWKRKLTGYKFTPKDDLMPGIPILWSPDGRYVAYFEYSHGAAGPVTSSRAVVVQADAGAPPVRVAQPGTPFSTRPAKWLSEAELKFKGLKQASMTGGEESFVFDLRSGMARTEAEYLAARAAEKARADSLARAAADSAARAAAPPEESRKKKK
ncbi:MAG: hypothetical protein HZB25_13590 [Candidatus Eisenbacteria bacterium]|nr:hypothetical protein [Candidatus Eisenbacteria bacterium]